MMDATQIRTIAPFALIGAALMLAVLAFALANSKPTSKPKKPTSETKATQQDKASNEPATAS